MWGLGELFSNRIGTSSGAGFVCENALKNRLISRTRERSFRKDTQQKDLFVRFGVLLNYKKQDVLVAMLRNTAENKGFLAICFR